MWIFLPILLGTVTIAEKLQRPLPDLFGSAVASAGDVNDDGVPDLLIGDPDTGGAWRGGMVSRGTVWLLSGRDGTVLWTASAKEPGDPYATCLLGPGDATGDGTPDFLIGGPRGVHLVDGRTHERAFTLQITRNHRSRSYYALASSPVLCALGDLDGDCRADFAVGTPYDESHGLDAGLVLIISGGTGLILAELYGEPGERVGIALANAGDLDGDDLADLAVTSYPYPYLGLGSGAVRVWTKVGSQLAYEVVADPPEPGYYGTALARAGDVNGDGVEDLAIGGYKSVRVVSGIDGQELWATGGEYRTFGTRIASFEARATENTFRLLVGSPSELPKAQTLLDAGSGVVIRRSPPFLAQIEDYRLFGRWADDVDVGVFGAGESVAAVGDLDGDGFVDYAVGAATIEAWAIGAVAIYSFATGERIRFFQRRALSR